MKFIKDLNIPAPWGKLVLQQWGNPDGEPMLLIHGRQDSSSVFIPLLELMPDHYNYVILDMPGNGFSDPFPHGPALTRFHFLAAMECAVNYLGWRKFIFVGHSMGCEQGLFYNAVYPDRITKLILLDAGPTLMRMQVGDLSEYQRLFVDPHYNNYANNFMRKTHNLLKAVELIKKNRGVNMTDAQAKGLLERNFHVCAQPPHPGRPSGQQMGFLPMGNRPIGQPIGAQPIGRQPIIGQAIGNKPTELLIRVAKPGSKFKYEVVEGQQRVFPVDAKVRIVVSSEPKLVRDPTGAQPARYVDTTQLLIKKARPNTKPMQNPTGVPLVGVPANTTMQAMVAPPGPFMHNPIGFLSWDNRLKNLGPLNSGNDYFFELFKKIPPTLLIAASQGAKKIVNPEWRQGAENLIARLLKDVKNLHVVNVEGEHDVHYTDPERVAVYVVNFLEPKVPEFMDQEPSKENSKPPESKTLEHSDPKIAMDLDLNLDAEIPKNSEPETPKTSAPQTPKKLDPKILDTIRSKL